MSHDHEHQEFERDWWGDCLNTAGEESKQLSYASRMRLEFVPYLDKCWSIDAQGKQIIDIGGGPVSLLLKTHNRGSNCMVVDPCEYPEWVRDRYHVGGIRDFQVPGEELQRVIGGEETYDEVWIYNCLQHTEDPKKIIENARKAAPVLRIFEWVNTGTSLGHPHDLKPELLNEWIGGYGTTEYINETHNGRDFAVGECYYGVFLTEAAIPKDFVPLREREGLL
jgi:hypothetical protein